MSEASNTLLLQKMSQDLSRLKDRLDSGGTSPPGGGGMEARIARLETSMSHVESDVKDIKDDIRTLRNQHRDDFRVLFGAIIVATVGAAAMFGIGYTKLSDRQDQLATTTSDIRVSLSEVKATLQQVVDRLPPRKP